MKVAIDFLSRTPSLTTIYLTGYFSLRAAGGLKGENLEGFREARALTEQDAASFQKNGEIVLRALLAANKDVIVIRDIPDLIFKPIECVRLGNRLMTLLRGYDDPARAPQRCGLDRAEYENRIAPYDRALSELLAKVPEVRVFDPRQVMCDADRCWAIRGNVPLYWNSDHLTVEGADLVVDRLLAHTAPRAAPP
jgi:hypothetical protein